jgi:hypothetical protein
LVKSFMPSACDSHVLGGVDDWYMLFLMTPDAFYAFLRALFFIVVPTWHRELRPHGATSASAASVSLPPRESPRDPLSDCHRCSERLSLFNRIPVL